MPAHAGQCRSGVEPPTGTIHPRKGRGTESEKQKSIPCLCSRHLYAGRGLNPRPERSTPAGAEEQSPENKNQSLAFTRTAAPRPLCVPSYAGRGLNPRPERSTPAGAEEQSPENKNQSLAFARAAAPHPLLCVPSRYAAELQWGDSRRRSVDAGKLPFSGLYSSAFAWVDHSGRGFNPRPAQLNPRPAQERQIFFFRRAFVA